MKQLLAWALATSDRVNPVAVREFRQAVQSQWVVAVLMLFLLVNLGVIGGYLMLSPDAESSIRGGQDIFTSLHAILLITCVAFVPGYVGIRLSMERNNANLDLLFITTITPGAIVRGKYISSLALTLLIFSACMPFMTLTYLLRGIDLPTIFFVLAFGFVVCMVANSMGIFAGTVSGSWFMRGIIDVGLLICLFYMAVGTIGMSYSSVYYGMGAARFWGSDFWYMIGMWLFFSALAVGLFYVLSVALLSPKPSNRMLIPRIYITICWAISGVAALIWSYAVGNFWPVEPWLFISGAALMILVTAALGERDSWTARVRRTIPRNPLLRAFAFIFYTGSAGGIAWATLLSIATFLTAYGWTVWVPTKSSIHYPGEELYNLIITFGYILCYCLTTALLRQTLLRRIPTANLPVIAAFMGVLAWLIPYLVVFFVERDWWRELPYYLVASPMVLTTSNVEAKNVGAVIMVGWLIACLLVCVPWALGQWRRFQPYKTTLIPQENNAVATN